MAVNPMQRKARNSFLLGMLLTLIVSAVIIAMLMVALTNVKKQQKELEGDKVSVYVLNREIKSGQMITPDMLTETTVLASATPANAITDTTELVAYSLTEKTTGTQINSDKEGYYYSENGRKVRVEQDGDNYYKVQNGRRTNMELNEIPLVAKVNMKENTVLTLNLVSKSNEIPNNDLRIQEFSTIDLPIFLQPDDYIDIRIQFPDGQNYIVVSKKRVVDVKENTVWIKLTEEEISMMSNAIVENYIITGSKVYANLYVEPGMQDKAIPTYVPSNVVVQKILSDPNVIEKSKQALNSRYNNTQVQLRNDNINGILNQYSETSKENIESKVKEELEIRAELKSKFMEDLEETEF